MNEARESLEELKPVVDLAVSIYTAGVILLALYPETRQEIKLRLARKNHSAAEGFDL